MIRTQLQLDEDVYDALRLRAHLEHKSMSAVVREVLRDGLGRAGSKANPATGLLSLIGIGASGHTDISERHDDYLAEDFR